MICNEKCSHRTHEVFLYVSRRQKLYNYLHLKLCTCFSLIYMLLRFPIDRPTNYSFHMIIWLHRHSKQYFIVYKMTLFVL